MTIYGREGSSPSAPNKHTLTNQIMCICINCEFYKKCWINKGLNKIPKVYSNNYFRLGLSKKKINNISNKIFFKIFLNIFLKNQNYEFDVIECEGFCENPGHWLN